MKTILILVIVCLIGAVTCEERSFKHGGLYEIVNKADDRVLSVPRRAESGERVSVVGDDEDIVKKWFAIENESSDRAFVLAPKIKKWREDNKKHRYSDLSDDVLVLTEDKHERSAVLEKYQDRRSQLWKPVRTSRHNLFLLRNVKTDRCLRFVRPSGVETASCDEESKKQQWRFNRVD